MADYEGSGSGPPLQSPGETPYQTPAASLSRASLSRRSSRPSTARESRAPSSSPPPVPEDARRHSQDPSTDENISILDPRRFTPTLHANLVSEILSLRRELDSKNQFIEDLESSLHSTKDENESLSRRLSYSNKEGRTAKRQIQQLEHGTLAALEELAKDRDEKKQAWEDLKDKVDKLERKIKGQEEEAVRNQVLWDRDRENFEFTKRALERRAHVSETRLKNVLAELAADQAAQDQQPNQESEDEDTRDSGLGNDSDTNSVRSSGPRRTPSRKTRHSRNMSSASQRSLHRAYRFSTQSDATGKVNGLSLADELDFDGEDEDGLGEIDENEEEDFPEHEAHARRAFHARNSFDSELKAKRVLGLAQDGALPTVNETSSVHTSFLQSLDGDSQFCRSSAETHDSKDDSGIFTSEVAVKYVDAAVQYSPPPSPQLTPVADETGGTFYDDMASVSEGTTHSRNQSLASNTAASGVEGRIQSMTSSNGEYIAASRVQSSASMSGDSAFGGSRMETPVPFGADAITISHVQRPAVIMVSTSAQTADEPLSPPATPKVSQLPEFIPSPDGRNSEAVEQTPTSKMTSISTQTDPLEELTPLGEAGRSLNREHKPVPLPIPSIAIHPPASAPSSPKETMLPPGTKNMGTQTRVDELMSMRSISIQTDEIRVDERLMKLPAHLQPSAIRSTPGSPHLPLRPKDSQQSFQSIDSFEDMSGPTATPKQLSEKALGKSPLIRSEIPSSPPTMLMSDSEPETEDQYPGNNDNGPLKRGLAQGLVAGKERGIRRPFRSGSLFAGFDSDKEDDKQGDVDDELLPEAPPAQPSFSIPSNPQRRSIRDLRDGRPYPKPPTPVPEDKEVTSRGSAESVRPKIPPKHQARNSVENARVVKRQPSIRRSALIKGGATAHAQRSRSPSLQSAGSSKRSSGGVFAPPPFPIPSRMSSRRLFPTSKSDGASSPTPRAAGLYNLARRNQKAKHIARNESLRKVRSAAVMPRRSGERSRSRSPPAPAMSRDSGPPPLPQDAITRSQFVYAAHRMNNGVQTPLTATDNASEGGQPSIVDAIAATMVGEWMWKYVRRRKSFNVTDPAEDFSRTAQDGSINVTGNGVRHKRWVWISPYERSVMWSSKQPASGSALMGKSGRKLLIQSVLDVKDDTPLPKGSSIHPEFNRSILILTPARALKFTAVSQERHYLWLTALSFLAHSNVGAPELAAIPPVPEVEPEPAPTTSSFSRRAPIRDSVRIARDKQRPSGLSSLASGSRDASRKDVPSILGPTITTDGPMSDAADAPNIPRYSYTLHGRKRSNTGPRIPPAPATLRNFSAAAVPSRADYSISSGPSHANSDSVGSDGRSNYQFVSGFAGAGQPAGLFGNSSSHRNSEATTASARPSITQQGADPGTVRMEAFVAPRRSNDTGSVISSAMGSSAGPGKMRAGGMSVVGRARGNTQWSSSTGTDPRRSGMIVMDEFDAFDPFKGF